MYKNLDYNPIGGFTAVASVSNSSWLFVVSSKLPVKTLDELIVYAKLNPGKLNFGFGLGSAPHLLGELLKVKTGIDVTSIPYKGGGTATTDLLSGQIHLAFGTAATLMPFVEDGRLRALAVTSNERWPELPDVPTMAEKGLGSLPSEAWTGVLGPPNLPSSIVERLNVSINEIVQMSKTKVSMAKLGYEPNLATPAQFAEFLVRDMEKWRAAVDAANLRID